MFFEGCWCLKDQHRCRLLEHHHRRQRRYSLEAAEPFVSIGSILSNAALLDGSMGEVHTPHLEVHIRHRLTCLSIKDLDINGRGNTFLVLSDVLTNGLPGHICLSISLGIKPWECHGKHTIRAFGSLWAEHTRVVAGKDGSQIGIDGVVLIRCVRLLQGANLSLFYLITLVDTKFLI